MENNISKLMYTIRQATSYARNGHIDALKMNAVTLSKLDGALDQIVVYNPEMNEGRLDYMLNGIRILIDENVPDGTIMVRITNSEGEWWTNAGE